MALNLWSVLMLLVVLIGDDGSKGADGADVVALVATVEAEVDIAFMGLTLHDGVDGNNCRVLLLMLLDSVDGVLTSC